MLLQALLLLTAVATTHAMPSPAETVELVNDLNQTVTATIGERSLNPGNVILEKRNSINCKGSSLCNNGHNFKVACQRARALIEDTTYTAGAGGASGVCKDTCGIFMQGKTRAGKPCAASGLDMRVAYDAIRRHGCQACGSDYLRPENPDCEVTINWVTGCGG